VIFSKATDFNGHFDSDRLVSEIEAAVETSLTSVASAGDVVTVSFGDTLTTGEDTLFAAVIAGHPLSTAKSHRKTEIDLKTQSLIGEGFTYGGEQFSLSLTAQSNWLGVLSVGAAAGLAYPYPVATMTNDHYMAADVAEMIAMATAALTRKGWAVGVGAGLKKAIGDAADQTALDAVVDNRA
jgi:hypothetical protein